MPGLHDLVSMGGLGVLPRSDGTHGLAGDAFYVELLPQGGVQEPGAMKVHGLTDAHLRAHGVPLEEGLRRLSAWAESLRPAGEHRLVFVGHNAPFDWSYVNWCYVRTGLRNPFGWKALDTKALAMGVLDLDWFETDKENLARLLPELGSQDEELVHRADYDARYQARILVGLLDHPRRRAARAGR